MRYTVDTSPTRARSSTTKPECSCSRESQIVKPLPMGCVERNQIIGWPERSEHAPPAERNHMLTRSPHAPANLSRRSQAQRRLRRAASQRLFCSTNGCTTYLVPDDGGLHADCPVCGLQRKLRADRHPARGRRQH